MAAHCSVDMALVPESVSRSIRIFFAVDEEQIVAGLLQEPLALVGRGLADRLDALDAEWLDNRVHY